MKKTLAILSAIAVFAVGNVQGQVSISTLNSAVVEDFESFTGAGFAPTPAAGQLDSDNWRVEGLSDGDSTFGGTSVTGDFARGASTGGVSTGGVYSFDTGSGNDVLGVQPAGSDFTPGSFTLRVQNNTGGAVNSWNIAYDLWNLNDQDRSNSFNFSWSLDDISYTSVGALDFTSPEAEDTTPTWASVARSTTISASVANGDLLYFQWTGDDVGGSGSRDEFGLDNVSVTAVPEPSTAAFLLSGLGLLALRRRRA